jgi:hypothetical protein
MPRTAPDEDLVKPRTKRTSTKEPAPAKTRRKSVVVDEDAPKPTEKQAKYAVARASGLKQKDAALAAGLAPKDSTVNDLEKTPAVINLLKAEHRKNAYMLGMTRETVLQGMRDAVDQAVMLADPMSQIAGWREIAKICGFYAPEVKKIVLGKRAERVLAEFEQMGDDELLQLAEADIIDVEFTEEEK